MRRYIAPALIAASSGLVICVPALAGDEQLTVAPEIKLVSAGDEPRQHIRFHFEEGDEQRILMTMHLKMTQTMNGQGMPLEMPPVTIPVHSTILGVDDSGASFEMVLGSVSVGESDSMMAGMYGNAMKQLEGIKLTGVVDEHGQKSNINVDTGGVTDPQLANQIDSIRNSLTQMTPPLPEEPVGDGASWNYTLHAESSGVKASNVTTIKLMHRDGDALALKMNVNISAEQQAVTAPAMPPGANLEEMRGSGTGTSTVKLDRLFPMAMEGTTNVQLKIKAPIQGQEMVIEQTAQMNISVEPKP